jgi:outer membrane protein OmpA-like peptidoglycan-associated protein
MFMSTWTTKYRAPLLTLTLAAAIAATLPVQAGETNEVAIQAQKPAKKSASKEENIGVASGLVVGAAAGGPVGAIIGAAAGAWMGDRYHQQSVKNASLKADLGKTEAERVRLARNVKELNGSLVDSQSKLDQAVGRASDLETDVTFRTADTSLTPDAMKKLAKLGNLATTLPGTTVRISGYTDPRGSKAFNQDLSERRAEAVAAALLEAGVPSDRMVIEGLGEEQSSSPEGDLDGYAFERKVVVRIEHEDGSRLASAQ